ncbi:T9SS type A sorting domain-containing protein [Hymenobacter lutimineralis]|uniref:T9SS type A sorting domain-containing protein n=1 Tax=Hymenobacter lutimineralis TaxID=2606448 RepID=A0A5D6VFK8_9BACT|nr:MULTISPECIES: M4 family metallopeptidase [Hymenobacter]QIX61293.1 T9SS type A sorting domain-containing protein [Hymenobacter sp. BT18]TYZ13508.1 T9SS type A sorting domain-containing protein [Hymenobacter lutimineralis]
MQKNYPAVALLVLGSAMFAPTQAQNVGRVKQRVVAEDGQLEMVSFAEGRSYKAAEAQQMFREQLGLLKDESLVRSQSQQDELGFVNERYQQYYKGYKVEHGAYLLHARQGAVEVINGRLLRGLDKVNTTPAMSEKQALSRALSFVGAKQYMWEEDNSFLPKGELVIVQNDLAKGAGKATLAYKFDVYAKAPVSRAYIYVDARSGEVVSRNNIIKHAAATGTFATRYSGTKSSATDSYNGTYRLREYTRGNGIETYNCKKGNSYTAAVDFTDADNSWTEYNNTNFDNAALDAHYGAQSTFDYFKNVHGRNSYNNAGAAIKSYVHFDDTPGDGKGYENAYWDGTRMTYGDGYSRFDPLTSLDVAAHEIGHAVCSYSANLTYSNESGAMNEGFSDIWGAAVEYYKDPAKATWLIGEDIDKVRPSLRSMSNPNAESQPDTYKGTYWYTGTGDNGGVHTNSGVLNHWFYRLSVGGSGTNDIGSSFSVTGIGIDKAAKIAYRTETVYLTASSNYAAARTGSIQAAKDLYGAGSAEEQAVTNAWYAVGVGAAYSGGGTTPPPTTVTYCASKGTNVSYEWIDYVKLGTIARTSSKDAGYYNGTATSTSVAAGSSQTISFSAGFASTAYTEYWKIYIDYNQNGVFTDAGELVVSGSSSSSGTLSSTFTVPATAKSGATRLRVIMSDASATTSCNSYSYGETEDYTVNITGGTLAAGVNAGIVGGKTEQLGNAVDRGLEVFPNPASDRMRIALPGGAKASSVKVVDLRGAAVAGARYNGEGELNISSLAKGMYIVTVSDGQKTFHQRFVKQ